MPLRASMSGPHTLLLDRMDHHLARVIADDELGARLIGLHGAPNPDVPVRRRDVKLVDRGQRGVEGVGLFDRAHDFDNILP